MKNQESDATKSGIEEAQKQEHGRELSLDGYKIKAIHFSDGQVHVVRDEDRAYWISADNFSGVVITDSRGYTLDMIPMTSIKLIEYEIREEEK